MIDEEMRMAAMAAAKAWTETLAKVDMKKAHRIPMGQGAANG